MCGQALNPFTDQVSVVIAGSDLRAGLCSLLHCQTSASFPNKNDYDRSARVDL